MLEFKDPLYLTIRALREALVQYHISTEKGYEEIEKSHTFLTLVKDYIKFRYILPVDTDNDEGWRDIEDALILNWDKRNFLPLFEKLVPYLKHHPLYWQKGYGFVANVHNTIFTSTYSELEDQLEGYYNPPYIMEYFEAWEILSENVNIPFNDVLHKQFDTGLKQFDHTKIWTIDDLPEGIYHGMNFIIDKTYKRVIIKHVKIEQTFKLEY